MQKVMTLSRNLEVRWPLHQKKEGKNHGCITSYGLVIVAGKGRALVNITLRFGSWFYCWLLQYNFRSPFCFSYLIWKLSQSHMKTGCSLENHILTCSSSVKIARSESLKVHLYVFLVYDSFAASDFWMNFTGYRVFVAGLLWPFPWVLCKAD